jgi:hypothetical protein
MIMQEIWWINTAERRLAFLWKTNLADLLHVHHKDVNVQVKTQVLWIIQLRHVSEQNKTVHILSTFHVPLENANEHITDIAYMSLTTRYDFLMQV